MKRLLLWTFERGSFHWNIMCGLILAFLFLPRNAFHDVPEFMRVSATEFIHTTYDKNRSTVSIVKLDTPRFFDSDKTQQAAVETLQVFMKKPVRASRIQPIRDWTGRVIAYAIWKEK